MYYVLLSCVVDTYDLEILLTAFDAQAKNDDVDVRAQSDLLTCVVPRLCDMLLPIWRRV